MKEIVTNHPSNENRFFLFIDIIVDGVYNLIWYVLLLGIKCVYKKFKIKMRNKIRLITKSKFWQKFCCRPSSSLSSGKIFDGIGQHDL